MGTTMVQLLIVTKYNICIVTHYMANLIECTHKNEHDFFYIKLVVANLLETRKKEVKLVTKESCVDITMTTSELSNGQEIEQKIVKELSALHSDFCSVDKQS